MESFSGAHGTSVRNANSINMQGFSAHFIYSGQSRYGIGIYFYQYDENGCEAALNWANYKYQGEESGACVLQVEFRYNPENCIFWNEKFEELVKKKAIQYLQEHNLTDIHSETKNEFRDSIINYLVQRKGINLEAIFTDFPLDINNKFQQKGCVVKNLSILPAPPYKIFTKENY